MLKISAQLPPNGPCPFNGFAREGLYLAGVIAQAAEYHEPQNAVEAIGAYAPARYTVYQQPDPYPWGFVFHTDYDVIVAFAGTQSALGWLFNVLGSAQQAYPGIPGQVSQWFGLASITVVSQMQADILTGLNGRPVTYVGHSLGGATAQIAYQILLRNIPGLSQVYTFGCPRVGNPDFANAFGIKRLFRVDDLGDPIPSLPPVLWAGPGSSYPIPGPGIPAFYVHGGDSRILDYQGYLEGGETQSFTTLIVNAIYGSQPITAHASAEYTRRLGLQIQFTAPAQAAENEVQAAQIETTVAPSTWETQGMPYSPPAAAKVEVWYSFQGEAFSEVFFSSSTPDVLISKFIPAYVTQRLTLATAGVRAIYARVSLVGNPRQISFWAPGLPYAQQFGQIKSAASGATTNSSPTPYVGTYFAAEVQPQQALLLRLRTTAGFWTRMFLHGFPAEVIQPGYYVPTVAFVQTLNNFIGFLSTNGGNWLSVVTSPNSLPNRISIVSITANAGRGATIIYTVPNPTPTGYPPQIGQPITVGGAGALEVGMNGRKVVVGFGGTPGQGQAGIIVGGTSPIGSGPQTGQAYFYILNQKGFAISTGQVSRLTTHKVGKLPFQPPGRRRNTIPLRR